MKKMIKRISIHQTSKVMGLLYFLLALIIALPASVYTFLYINKTQALIWLIIPFFYLIVGYIAIAILSWFYNIIASIFGGIEVSIEDVEIKK